VHLNEIFVDVVFKRNYCLPSYDVILPRKTSNWCNACQCGAVGEAVTVCQVQRRALVDSITVPPHMQISTDVICQDADGARCLCAAFRCQQH